MLTASCFPRLNTVLAVFVLVATILVACASEQGRPLYSLETNGAIVDWALAITPDGSLVVKNAPPRMARTTIRHPESVNCPTTRWIAPLS